VPELGAVVHSKIVRRPRASISFFYALTGCLAAFAAADLHAQTPQDSGGDDTNAQLEEVVVTARHQAEAAQRVPIALTSLSATQLSDTRTASLVDLAPLVPSMQLIQFNPRNTNLTIRGLGSNVAIVSDGLETGVGVYIDGVYYARPGQAMFDMFDLERVEVLRGPQGTLFGRNTTAGAVTIYTAQPTFSPEANAEIAVGDYGYYQLRGVASGPISDDKVAGRLSLYGTSRGGFVRNVRTGQSLHDYDNDGARAQLLFRPTDDFSVRVIGDYSYLEENCCANVPAGVATVLANGQPFPNGFYSRAARIGYTPLPIDPEARTTDVDSPVHAKAEQGGASVQADWTLDKVVLTGISSYRYWNWYPQNDFDDIGAPILTTVNTPSRQRQASQELRITSSTDDAVQYTGGLFYFHENLQSSQLITYGAAAAGWTLPASVPLSIGGLALNGLASAAHDSATTDSYAAYGQATWHIDDRWSVTGGLRYTFDDKSGMFAQKQQGGVMLSSVPLLQQPLVQAIRDTVVRKVAYSAGVDQGAVSGTAIIAYQIDDQTLVYGSYARGVKSSGINLAALPPGVSPSLKPESIDDYELGLKTTLFDRRLSLNAALYWSEDSDYQSLYANPLQLSSYIANVGKVRSRGVEIDLRASPLDGLSLTLSGAYDAASYLSYPMGPCPLEQINQMVCDLSGRPLPGAPRWATSLAVEYIRPAGQLWAYGVNGYIGGQYSYRSSVFTGINDSIYARVPGYSLLDLRAGLRADDETWDLSFWARNATDTFYYGTIGPAPLNSGLVAGTLGAPRTLGGTLKVKF
jgi:iron complex outermembrane receptor protein